LYLGKPTGPNKEKTLAFEALLQMASAGNGKGNGEKENKGIT
jgi:hypothetical protein